ncbi:MAG TPA: type IX secretion system protein PorQ [Bacteroidia bacterium]|nr:type IX secretion system protein PorQ [Bacteroidia bacterium]
MLTKFSNKKIYAIFLLQLIGFASLKAQTGGNTVYNFLNLIPNARIAALGGYAPAVRDHDLNIGLINPSMLNKEMHNQLSLNYLNFVSGINYGMVGYGYHHEKFGTFSAGMQYINYGKFIEADETSLQTGTFTGGEYAFNLGWGKKIDSVFSVGANFKPIYSSISNYNSFGLGIDISGAFIHPNKLFTATFLARNIGFQLTPYTNANREPIPLNVELGLSQKLKHVPLRFNLIATNLQKYKLTYTDSINETKIDPTTNQIIPPNKKIGENLLRHFVLGAEFLITKNFNLRFSYNYNKRKDLVVSSRTGLSGFAVGAGIKLSKFIIGYSHSFYHLAGGTDLFSLSMNLHDFKKKTSTPTP